MDSKSKGTELFVKLPDTTPISDSNASTALKFLGIEQLKAPGAKSKYINWNSVETYLSPSTVLGGQPLLPFEENPEAIIRATNAGKCQADLLLANLHCQVQQQAQAAWLPSLPPSPPPADPAWSPLPPALIVPLPLPPAVEPIIPETPPCFRSLVVPFHPPSLPSPFLRVLSAPVSPVNAPATKSLKPPPKPDMSGPSSGKAPLSSDDKADLTYIRMLMETQHNSMIQSQQNYAASAERMTRFEEASAQCIARLEESIMLLSTKREDLTNPFKSKLFRFALPPLWRTTLRDQLCDFRMRDTKAFSFFNTRARTLQTLVNSKGGADAIDGERSPTISDLELDEAVLHGLPAELKALVKNHQVLLTRPF
ncbi:hypothetical protein PCANC_15360 [Puccinia coronata f. sp. avenae]|uniref:Uncharacterized protein n=1 Tax=Puccinia coronata f. sp. avenae TaxID=200324 RepID=A0A2N5SS43_9BASI|nr:hypothetical protein PCANC_15360 [Puccinia coronata f. sp. avenae]